MHILCDESNEACLSTAFLDPIRQKELVMGRNNGFILEPMNTNLAAAFKDDFITPLKKGYQEFKDFSWVI